MASNKVIRARHYATGQPIAITVANGLIQALDALPHDDAPFVAPGFFDLQINGCLGLDFTVGRLTTEDVYTVVQECRRHGMDGFCPTLITNSFANLRDGFRRLVAARSEAAELARAMPCFHLEGPYLSPEDGPRGAHPREHVRPPDWEEMQRLQDAAGGLIRLVTLAPEWEGALAFIEKLAASGVVPALGHTAATSERIRDAIRAGARLATHLGNGCHAMLHRHDNPLWEQIAHDDLWASIIADGHHLPPAMVKTIIRAKTPGRVILTCDASSLAGLPPGRHEAWGQSFDVLPEGKIVVPGTPFLAGSWVFTDTCIANAMRYADLTLAQAIDLATARPRQLLGLPPASLQPGAPADLVLFDLVDGDLRVRSWIGPEGKVAADGDASSCGEGSTRG